MRLSDLAKKAAEPKYGYSSFLQYIFYVFSQYKDVLQPVKETSVMTEALVQFGSSELRPNEYSRYVTAENLTRYLKEAQRGAKLMGLYSTNVVEKAHKHEYEIVYDITQDDLIKFIGILRWKDIRKEYGL